MRVVANPMPGAFLLEVEPKADERGHFARAFCRAELQRLGVRADVAQANLSMTKTPGTVRGMHYQRPPHGEVKVVQCLQGEVFDALIDLRRGSPTFGKSFDAALSPSNGRVMVVPEGCAHGFQALRPDSLVHYLVSCAYAPEAEAGLRFDDPFANVRWPLPVRRVSPRDLRHAWFDPQRDALDVEGYDLPDARPNPAAPPRHRAPAHA